MGIVRITNKVRLCERSEPQSEPFVGQARREYWEKPYIGNIFFKPACSEDPPWRVDPQYKQSKQSPLPLQQRFSEIGAYCPVLPQSKTNGTLGFESRCPDTPNVAFGYIINAPAASSGQNRKNRKTLASALRWEGRIESEYCPRNSASKVLMISRLASLSKSPIAEVAELAQAILEVARAFPFRKMRIRRIARERRELIPKLEKMGLIEGWIYHEDSNFREEECELLEGGIECAMCCYEGYEDGDPLNFEYHVYGDENA